MSAALNSDKFKFLILPLFYWVLLISGLNLLNSLDRLAFVTSFPGHSVLIRLVLFIVIPCLIIVAQGANLSRFGLHSTDLRTSLKLAFKTWTVTGPIGASSFVLVLYVLKLDVYSWTGSLIITLCFLFALILTINVLGKYSISNFRSETRDTLVLVLGLIILSGVASVLLESSAPFLSSILIYISIVGFGEEILFRGYLQSSFNIIFGKPFSIRGVEFGFGLIISAALFGLSHALVQTPFDFTSATFTTVGGLIFGAVREKENSIMACSILHGLMDIPKVLTPN